MQITVRKISDGLGFGNGSISAAALKDQAGEDAFAKAVEAISSQEILEPLGALPDGSIVDDDGCGDGRPVGRIFAVETEKHTSLPRAKVFGGGVAMTVAALIALGKTGGGNLEAVFADAISQLHAKRLNFGAHTADRVADAAGCGCGAIDNAPAIIAAAVSNAAAITEALTALGVDTSGLDSVLANYGVYAKAHAAEAYAGAHVMRQIRAGQKVVKELTGPHLEAFIVLNTVPGFSVNQHYVRKASGGKLDVFATDLWRLHIYAEQLFDTDAERHAALLGELVYTLATAAVLTSGDLPVYLVSRETPFTK